jgi:hypothetical protein
VFPVSEKSFRLYKIDFENQKLRDVLSAQTGMAIAQGQADRDRVAGQNSMVQSGMAAGGQVYSGYKADQAAQAQAAQNERFYEQDLKEREKDRIAKISTNRSAGAQ